jgi:ubiquinol-cytochrome c reductase cytochrome b subunit
VIPNPFWGGVLFPSIVFGALFAWPALERRLTRDRHPHNLIDRPRDAPNRTGIATAILCWVFIIFMAGSADRAYVLLGWSYQTQIEVYRVLVFVGPVVAWWLARRICVELLRNERVEARRQAAELEAEQAAGRG